MEIKFLAMSFATSSRLRLIPELVGRLPVATYLEPLNHETLRKILTHHLIAHTQCHQGKVALEEHLR